ncbi:MAG TPA: GNAT family N-acetyltransferase [Flavitalea sp.]|nr:GNAT family N-acetyltransferase [Flavitalea sp.]
MENISLMLNEQGHGGFYIKDGDKQVAEMSVSLAGNVLTVHHTEVFPEAEGKGLGKRLFAGMTDYARKNGLTVVALCPFVYAQFKKNRQEYADIWRR